MTWPLAHNCTDVFSAWDAHSVRIFTCFCSRICFVDRIRHSQWQILLLKWWFIQKWKSCHNLLSQTSMTSVKHKRNVVHVCVVLDPIDFHFMEENSWCIIQSTFFLMCVCSAEETKLYRFGTEWIMTGFWSALKWHSNWWIILSAILTKN